jgi:hypothetical protein
MSLSYDNLRLSKNEIEINISPIDPLIADRSKMRYYLEVYIPTVKNASDWKLLPVLDAPEEPLQVVGETTIAKGAFFLINELLHSYLATSTPDVTTAEIQTCDDLVMPFKMKLIRKNNGVIESQNDSGVEYVMRAGILEEHLREWEQQFFSDYLGANQLFLTWNPTTVILPEQPILLYFLTNMKPTPTALKLRVFCYYEDGTEDDAAVSVSAIDDVQYMNVYAVPVGAKVLGLLDKTKKVIAYKVWLVNKENEVVSKEMNYRIDYRRYRETRYIVFQNSLGGYDTLAITGDTLQTLNVIRQEAERYKPYQSPASYSEIEVSKVTGAKQITINTGWLNEAQRDWLNELTLSEAIFIVTDRGLIPMKLIDESYTGRDTEERAIGRQFVFSYTNIQRNFSNLPIAPVAAARATAWRSAGVGACQLDGFGKRTGKQYITTLEKYYIDDDSTFQPYTVKANSPGTEGYLTPQVSVDCAVTPYLNIAYSATGTYLKNDCPTGEYGTAALIGIDAGRWGSEISQTDANAKALAEWNTLNTQATANAAGACTAMLAGITGKYYNYAETLLGPPNNSLFSTAPTLTRNDAQIDFQFHLAPPAGMSENLLAVQWNGFVKAPFTGAIKFIASQFDDGMRVWVNGVLVVNKWTGMFPDVSEGTINLVANQFYSIRVEYYNYYGAADCELQWSYTGQAAIVIPAGNLYRTA